LRLARYDFLIRSPRFCAQGLLLVFRLETPREALVILIYHMAWARPMEVFKLRPWARGLTPSRASSGSAAFRFSPVSCMPASAATWCRAIRIFDMRFEPYPAFWMHGASRHRHLREFLHASFLLGHARWLLFAATILIFARTRIWFTPDARSYLDAPAGCGVPDQSIFLWIAGKYRDDERHMALSRPESLATGSRLPSSARGISCCI